MTSEPEKDDKKYKLSTIARPFFVHFCASVSGQGADLTRLFCRHPHFGLFASYAVTLQS